MSDNTGRICAIFDVDGTLTHTNKADAECFLLALRDIFEFTDISDDWSSYKHVTDAGILDEVVFRHRGRQPSSAEQQEFIRSFVAHLERLCAKRPDGFRSVRGAGEFLNHISGMNWSVAMATGGWLHSALLKLDKAGINTRDWPLASSNDGVTRVDIVRSALKKMDASPTTDQIALFGDAVWDIEAAKELGKPVIIICPPERASAMRDAGAALTIQDFANPDKLASRVMRILRPAR